MYFYSSGRLPRNLCLLQIRLEATTNGGRDGVISDLPIHKVHLHQGDLIGRSFAYRAIVYFGHLQKVHKEPKMFGL
jgi:hypothetical protein